MINFASNIDGCSEFQIKSFSDSDKQNPTMPNVGTFLPVNPLTRDLTTGALNRTIHYVIPAQGIPTTVFIQGSTNPEVSEVKTADLRVDFEDTCAITQPKLTDPSFTLKISMIIGNPAQNFNIANHFKTYSQCGSPEYFLTSDASLGAFQSDNIKIIGGLLNIDPVSSD